MLKQTNIKIPQSLSLYSMSIVCADTYTEFPHQIVSVFCLEMSKKKKHLIHRYASHVEIDLV